MILIVVYKLLKLGFADAVEVQKHLADGLRPIKKAVSWLFFFFSPCYFNRHKNLNVC